MSDYFDRSIVGPPARAKARPCITDAAAKSRCGRGSDSRLTVENPSICFIIKSRPAAGYFTPRNNTGSAVDLTGASSSACGMVMLHQSREESGVEKMLSVKSVSVPPHCTIRFTPGGYHLMCMSPSMK